MNLSAYQETVTRVCFDAEPKAADLRALGHEARWQTYRRMVRARLERVVRTALPRTVESLGETFLPFFRDWLAEHGPRSPLFRTLPIEFQEFVTPRLDGFGRDLARYEALSWSLRDVETPPVKAKAIDFERPLVLQPALRRMRTDNLVHRRVDQGTQVLGQKRHLILYRNPEHRVITLVVNGLTYDLVGAWLAPHTSLADAIRGVAERRGEVMGPTFMESLGTLLADYLERGIVLGSADRASL